jgi:hypothetical protein
VILHDRDAGPAPLRVVRMLAFAADTLRGTTLAPGAYRGAHRGAHPGGAVKAIRWLATGLLLLGALLCPLLALLAYEGYIAYQLIAGASLVFSATFVLVHLAAFAASRIPRRTATASWYSMGKVAAGVGLLVRAIASEARWGHPLLFAIISYCGYAISAACLGVAVVLLIRAFPRSSARAVTKAGNQARSG